MRRSKPQQPIYKPGSGPLRRSIEPEHQPGQPSNTKQPQPSFKEPPNSFRDSHPTFKENSDEVQRVINRFDDLSTKERRPRKPEQNYYVPKVNRYGSEEMERKPVAHSGQGRYISEGLERNLNGNHSGSSEHLNVRSKRYTNTRRGGRGDSPQRQGFTRQGSEPRVINRQPHTPMWSREVSIHTFNFTHLPIGMLCSLESGS